MINNNSYQKFLPDIFIKNLFSKISRPFKLAFSSALIFAFITHVFMFLNKLPNGDDLRSMYRDFGAITSGRWFDKIAMSLSSYYSMPWVTGVVAIFFLALSVAFIVSLLEIRKSSNIILIAALMTTFPILAALYSYMFYGDLYMIAMFFSIVGIWLAKRYSYGFIAGGLSLALALGSYQSYISFSIILAILSLFLIILKNERSFKEILLLAIRYLLTGLLGITFYFLILKFSLSYFQLTLTDYQGIDNMGRIPWSELLSILPQSYERFYNFLFADTYLIHLTYIKILHGIFLVLIALLSLGAIINNLVYRKLSLLLIPILLFSLPLAFEVVLLMAPDAYVHSLMYSQYALFFIIPLCLSEAAFEKQKEGKNQWRFEIIASWILLLSSSVFAYNFYLTSNIAYLHLHLKYEITYATELRILDRMEQHPGYDRQMPVFFVGAFPNENQSIQPANTRNLVRNLQGINGNLVHHDSNYKGFYLNYLGVELNLASEEERAQILEKLKTYPMPKWPEAGSVDIIDGIMVIHLNS